MILVCLLFTPVYLMASEKQISDDKIKLLFLFKFLSFCEWPADKFESEESEFKIGIVDDGTMLKTLKTQPSKKISGRNVIYEHINYDFTLENLSQYHIVFIRDSDSAKLPSIIEKTKGLSVLTVSESNKNKMPNSMINLIKKNRKIRFMVNNSRAIKEDIKIKSQLLRLAMPN